ncbi:LysR substrate-binding domain-containing protein, partial [Streptomyces sp. NPDC048279]|uniref:LysR substrate-binding domain-containing protein n=1 Tax=Streptomyces sp. NPDC048279 TaxID=3154714 RepID=UPI00343C8F23
APAFAAAHLTGPLPDALAAAPVIVFDRVDDFQDAFLRRLGRDGASSLRHYVPTSEGFVEAVTAGLGWGMVPQAQAEPRLREGRLVRLGGPRLWVDTPLYWQQWKLDSPALGAVAEAVVKTARGALRRP